MIRDITIVSLSRGILGESFIRHELEIGVRRLESYGLKVHFSRHALMGLEYLKDHPEDRASDLLEALRSDTDMILCAVGGDDTYRLLPYLFDHDELQKASEGCRKIFLGFSDTTMNHFMLHKVGMKTFYGQAFLPDICELSPEILSYTRRYFEELIESLSISRIKPSGTWFDSREDFSASAIGTSTSSHPDRGFVILQGPHRFSGKFLGGCIDTIYDGFNSDRYADSVELCTKYGIIPPFDDWRGHILLLETSEEKASPEKFRLMVQAIKEHGIFGAVSGVVFGKPVDETYYDDYNRILLEVIDDESVPVLVNVNVGHSMPRCIIPLGVEAVVDADEQVIEFVG